MWYGRYVDRDYPLAVEAQTGRKTASGLVLTSLAGRGTAAPNPRAGAANVLFYENMIPTRSKKETKKSIIEFGRRHLIHARGTDLLFGYDSSALQKLIGLFLGW